MSAEIPVCWHKNLNKADIFTTLATLFAVRDRRTWGPDLNDNKFNMDIEKAMSLLRSFGDINPTLTQCRQYFEMMMSLTTTQGSIPDVENTYRFGIPAEYQAQPLRFTSPTNTDQPTPHMSALSRFRQSTPNLQARDSDLRITDQNMANFAAELFSDGNLGAFNFGTLDPILQM